GNQFGVSRATVRQALQRLESEGLIQRIKGRGTFVAGAREHSWLVQSSGGLFHQEGGRMGVALTPTVLPAAGGPPTHPCTDSLGRGRVGSAGLHQRRHARAAALDRRQGRAVRGGLPAYAVRRGGTVTLGGGRIAL